MSARSSRHQRAIEPLLRARCSKRWRRRAWLDISRRGWRMSSGRVPRP